MAPEIAAFATREVLMQAAAERVAEALGAGIAQRGRACAALSGGATPEPAYTVLAHMPLDWSKIAFALVDERYVPRGHPASNEALLRRALAPALAQGAALVPMYAGAMSPAAAADLADRAYAPLALDIALLGMGADAHTASWFPGAAGLEHFPALSIQSRGLGNAQSQTSGPLPGRKTAHTFPGSGLAEALDPKNPRTVVAIHARGAAGAADRLTLTRAALARAGRVLLLITGDEKRARLERAMQESESEAPVAALFAPGMAPVTVLWAP